MRVRRGRGQHCASAAAAAAATAATANTIPAALATASPTTLPTARPRPFAARAGGAAARRPGGAVRCRRGAENGLGVGTQSCGLDAQSGGMGGLRPCRGSELHAPFRLGLGLVVGELELFSWRLFVMEVTRVRTTQRALHDRRRREEVRLLDRGVQPHAWPQTKRIERRLVGEAQRVIRARHRPENLLDAPHRNWPIVLSILSGGSGVGVSAHNGAMNSANNGATGARSSAHNGVRSSARIVSGGRHVRGDGAGDTAAAVLAPHGRGCCSGRRRTVR